MFIAGFSLILAFLVPLADDTGQPPTTLALVIAIVTALGTVGAKSVEFINNYFFTGTKREKALGLNEYPHLQIIDINRKTLTENELKALKSIRRYIFLAIFLIIYIISIVLLGFLLYIYRNVSFYEEGTVTIYFSIAIIIFGIIAEIIYIFAAIQLFFIVVNGFFRVWLLHFYKNDEEIVPYCFKEAYLDFNSTIQLLKENILIALRYMRLSILELKIEGDENKPTSVKITVFIKSWIKYQYSLQIEICPTTKENHQQVHVIFSDIARRRKNYEKGSVLMNRLISLAVLDLKKIKELELSQTQTSEKKTS